jgi:hypothetical protein
MMQDMRPAGRHGSRNGAYPLNIVGTGCCPGGSPVRRTEMFGCDSVVLAEGPMAGRATLLRGARGVLLRREPSEPGETWYEIAVVDAEGRDMVSVERVSDDAALIAHWRRLGLDLGLPLLVEDADGGVLEPYGQIGSVLLGPGAARRRLLAMVGRRPRFLSRRKPGRFADRPVVIRGREIIARS